jgi:hypothetical protein
MFQYRLQLYFQAQHLLMRLHIAAAAVYSVGSSVAVPCLDVALVSQADMDLRLGFQQGNPQSRGSWAAGGIVVAVVGVGATVLGLAEGNVAVQVAAHIVVSREVVHSGAVYWRLRLVEADNFVAVDAREETKVAVGKIGCQEEARSTVAGVGREAEDSSSRQGAESVGVLTWSI